MPTRRACAPAWCERLSTTSYSLFTRPVGEPESVPKEATPEMLTAGPMRIAGRRFQVAVGKLPACFIDRSRGQSHHVADREVWSLLSRSEEAVGALRAPAPRELLALTS